MDQIIRQRLAEHMEVLQKLSASDMPLKLEKCAKIVERALAEGHKVLFCGNGGSAADSQHLAAEFVGRFQKERKGLPAVALTVDTSILTAIANDYGYETVFARQVQALGEDGDVLVGISTSGNSQNVLLAIKEAKGKGIKRYNVYRYDRGRRRENGRRMRYLSGGAGKGHSPGPGNAHIDGPYLMRTGGS